MGPESEKDGDYDRGVMESQITAMTPKMRAMPMRCHVCARTHTPAHTHTHTHTIYVDMYII